MRGEHLVAVYGEVPMTYDTLPSVWVEDGNRTAARQRIEQALQGRTADPEWTCVSCGELREAQFTECWKCGAPRPQG